LKVRFPAIRSRGESGLAAHRFSLVFFILLYLALVCFGLLWFPRVAQVYIAHIIAPDELAFYNLQRAPWERYLACRY